MHSLVWLIFGICAVAAAIHFASVAVAIYRCRERTEQPKPVAYPPVSLVRPVCGLDAGAEITLRSTFEIDYPDYEIIFFVAQPNDAAIPLLKSLLAQYPHAKARLLVGDDAVSDNPKLNNCVKGWREAKHEWIVLSDSNVILPRDYIERLLARWDDETGLVCVPPAGGYPQSIPAEFECVFLNEYQARWQYFADTLGAGFAQGKTMLWRRDLLEARGGIAALGAETAEDAASTKIVREAGLSVKLADAPFIQPLGRRGWREVWKRQVRWARLRRASFTLCFALEIFSGGVWPSLLAAYGIWLAGLPLATAAVLPVAWYGAELWLARAAGWHVNWRSPFIAIVRDGLIPILWIEGWRARGFEWRGNAMIAAPQTAR